MSGRHASLLRPRLLALFAAGCLLFSNPLLDLFGGPRTLGGVPVFYLYLFAAWGLLIGVLAWLLEGPRSAGEDHGP